MATEAEHATGAGEAGTRDVSPVCIVDQVLETRVSTPMLKPPRESYILRRRASSEQLFTSVKDNTQIDTPGAAETCAQRSVSS